MIEHPFIIARDSFQAAYDLLPMGIVVVNTDGSIVFVNRSLERLLGYPHAELVGQSVECLVPEHLVSSHRVARSDYIHHAVARPMGAGRELWARHRDGHKVPVEIGLSPVTHGEESFIVSTVIDVRDRRQLEEQVRQMQKEVAIGNLAAGIAHDFNNILLSIMGYAELAQDVTGLSSEIESHLADILQNANRGRDLVGHILHFARKTEPARRAIGWEPIISDSLRLIRVSLPANVTVQVQSEANVPSVWANPTELQQTFVNLVTKCDPRVVAQRRNH